MVWLSGANDQLPTARSKLSDDRHRGGRRRRPRGTAQSRELIDDRPGVAGREAERLAVGAESPARRHPSRPASAASARRHSRPPARGATGHWLCAATVSFSVATKITDCPSGAHTAPSASPPKPGVAAAFDPPNRLRALRLPSTSTTQRCALRFVDPVIEVADRERLVDAHLRLRVLPLLHRFPIRLLVGRARPHHGLEEDLPAVRAPSRHARRGGRARHALRLAAARRRRARRSD